MTPKMTRLGNKTTQELLELVRKLVLPLSPSLHKGQAGRIVVVGGSEDYTGAPYFSAMASTLLGADMSHIVCEASAGQVIKTYSPNLMVHPYLYSSRTIPSGTTKQDILARVEGILDRVHVIVVGPGLGRDELMLELAKGIIESAKRRQLPIVIDADGLFLLQQNIDLIRGYANAVLTPNIVEMKRLENAAGLAPQDGGAQDGSRVSTLSKALHGVAIVQKGQTDFISNGKDTISDDVQGSNKRVSGQGDTLSGSIATFLAWRTAYHKSHPAPQSQDLTEADTLLLAAFGGSAVTRTAANLAFKKHGRALLTSHLSDFVGGAYTELELDPGN